MQILSTGGTMSAIEEQPETIVEHLNALWDNQNNRPIPTDIRWEDYAPEKVMLRFKDEQAGSTISRRTRMLQGFQRDLLAMNG